MSDLMLQAVLRVPPEAWQDDALDVKQRHGRYVQAADELEALRAALDQERADCAKARAEVGALRAFAQHIRSTPTPISRFRMNVTMRSLGLLDDQNNPTALLSGRGEGGNDG